MKKLAMVSLLWKVALEGIHLRSPVITEKAWAGFVITRYKKNSYFYTHKLFYGLLSMWIHKIYVFYYQFLWLSSIPLELIIPYFVCNNNSGEHCLLTTFVILTKFQKVKSSWRKQAEWSVWGVSINIPIRFSKALDKQLCHLENNTDWGEKFTGILIVDLSILSLNELAHCSYFRSGLLSTY